MGFRDPPDPCRRRTRPDDRGAGGADLPDDELRPRRHEAGGRPVRPRRDRQRLHPDHEPDAGRCSRPASNALEGGCTTAVGLPGTLAVGSGQAAATLAVLNLGGAGTHIVSSSSLYGGTYNLFHYTFPKLGVEVTFVDDPDDLGQWRAAVQGQHGRLLRRDDPEPEERRVRHRGRLRRGPRGGRPADPRQHGAVAVPDPPDRVGRRHRRAQPHQVPRRPRQLDRRRHHRQRHVRLLRVGPLPRLRRARPQLPRPAVLAGPRRRVLHHQGPRPAAA